MPSDNSVSLAGAATDGGGRIVLVGGVGTVLLSEDGGSSFRLLRLPDRLNLGSALFADGRLILAGQGGVKFREVTEIYD